MYGAVLPSYKSKKDGENGKNTEQDIVKVDDPKNRERVKQIFEQFD